MIDSKEDLISIELLQGSLCKGVYINDSRITPNKPMGMMNTIYSVKVPKQFLVSRLRTLLKELEE